MAPLCSTAKYNAHMAPWAITGLAAGYLFVQVYCAHNAVPLWSWSAARGCHADNILRHTVTEIPWNLRFFPSTRAGCSRIDTLRNRRSEWSRVSWGLAGLVSKLQAYSQKLLLSRRAPVLKPVDRTDLIT